MKIDTITICVNDNTIRCFINGLGTIDNIKTITNDEVYLGMNDIMKCLGFEEDKSNDTFSTYTYKRKDSNAKYKD